MSLFFLDSQSSISNFEHIWIIPASRSWGSPKLVAGMEIVFDWSPSIKNILCCSPRVPHLRSPRMSFFFSPIANREYNISSSFMECISHIWVSFYSWHIFVVAIIVLKIVDTPFSEIVSVSLFVSQRSRSSLASLDSSGGVNTKL